jgi:hypothetical protein
MFTNLPYKVEEFMGWSWAEIAPFYEELAERPLTSTNIHDWLSDWTQLGELLSEWQSRLNVVTTQDTTNVEAELALNEFMTAVYPHVEEANTHL